MKNRFCVLALALAALTSVNAAAAEPSYTYVQASYNWSGITTDGAAPDIDMNGWNIEGSFEFSDHFYAFTGYQDADGDDWNASTWNIGAGYKMPVFDGASWFTQVKYIDESIEHTPTSLNTSDSGFGLGTGLRFGLSDSFELTTAANYTWVNGVYGDGFGLGAAGEYKFNKVWSSTLGYAYSWRSDINISDVNVGVRANF